jgi:hypothetical protein
MKNTAFNLSLTFMILGLSLNAAAAPAKAKKLKPAPAPSLSRDVNFDGSTVTGRYQTATEGVVTVENEKVLSDLLKAPRDFKERLAHEAAPIAKDAK